LGVQFSSRFGAIRAGARAKAARAVEKTARDIEAGAKQRSRVDSGQMRGGWSVEPISETSKEVFNEVEHAVYNEFGTVHMSAQPMLGPAAEEARPGFLEALSQLTD